jgi:methionyl-tRNA formyltransferase
MTPQLDAGPCLVQEVTRIGPKEDAVQLEQRLAELGCEAVQNAVEMLDRWDGRGPLGEVQDRTQVSRAPQLKKSDGAVDWSRTAQQIFDQVRAFKPWPGSFTHWSRSGEPLRLLLDRVQVDQQDGNWGEPGTILQADPQGARVACGEGTLILLEIQPAGKRKMSIDQFLRGYPLKTGQQLE